ncbi:uncharacterized protein LOC132737561, partial [Ruditapes philippinarum]|uniref:uncharacterized protein LOC132737561 n=1 Tax=Ruditapes philippinarum TaxID=129788 RepID=UPI00295ABA22
MTMFSRRQFLSESDLPLENNKMYRRESITDYITSRRGSLSDLVFSNSRYLARDSLGAQLSRRSRHLSLSSQTSVIAQKQRSSSLVPLQKSQILPRDIRSEYNTNTLSNFEKRFMKTKSLNSFNGSSTRVDDQKRNSKGQINLNKRRKLLKKIKSLQTFDSVLKARQSRRRFDPLAKFRRAARIVLLLLKATASSRHASQGHQDHKSWSQLAEEQSTAKRTYDLFGISFDPSMFKAKREKYLSNEAKVIMSMYPGDRSDEQVKLALLALNQTVEAFGEFPIKLQKSLASVGWYENFEAKRVIIRQGHMADNFYFILSGTAVVTLLETNRDTGEEGVRTVAFLRKGNSFGELALMHGAKRSATVTCQTNVELLAVSREDFIDIFMHIEKDKEPDHISFLRNIDVFRGWPVEKLPHNNPRICLFTFFRRGVLLCKDSNATDWIYVIKTGTCRVLKDLFDTRPNIPGLEYVPYSLKQSYTKLPPIPHNKSGESTPRSFRHSQHHSPRHLRLPDIYKRSSEQLVSEAIEHQAKL